MEVREFGVLGPLPQGDEPLAFLGCEIVGGLPVPSRAVVVVCLPDPLAADQARLARLQRETAFATTLHHAGLLEVHGLDYFEEGWAHVSEFHDGETLDSVVKRLAASEKHLPDDVLIRIMADLCSALSYAADAGLNGPRGRPHVHGLLRPSVVQVGYDGSCRLAGFGAAALTDAGKFIHFLPPERVIGGSTVASAADDVYGLGALMYYMLALSEPYAKTDDVKAAIASAPPVLENVPPARSALVEIANQALRRENRFEGPQQMEAALRTAAETYGCANTDSMRAFLTSLFTDEDPDRRARQAMLAAAQDPDTVTFLSVMRPPDDIDRDLFAAARPSQEAKARFDTDRVAAPESTPTPVVPLPVAAPLAESIEEEDTGRLPGRGPRTARPRVDESAVGFKPGLGHPATQRVVLALVAAVAALVLAYKYAEAPEVVQGEPDRRRLPAELVRRALNTDRQNDPSNTTQPQPQARGLGQLTLKTEPPVDVYLENRLLGRTPLETALPGGQHNLRLTDGVQRINLYRNVQVVAQQETKVEIEIGFGFVQIDAPDNAKILLNGAPTAPRQGAAHKLYEGRYHLEVRHRTGRWIEMFNVRKRETVRFTFPPKS